MSLATWKEEFYPVPADQVPKEQALQHSLSKWRGLTPDNLEKHSLASTGTGRLCDSGVKWPVDFFDIDSATCALCFYYIKAQCCNCPLAKYRGGINCDKTVEGEENSPYELWCCDQNEQPMIALLEAALQKEQTA